jgi:general secretion pathway protein G
MPAHTKSCQTRTGLCPGRRARPGIGPCTCRRKKSGHLHGPHSAGFTLLEIFIVITIILILLSIAIPSYRHSVVRARETVLRENLFVLRKTIEEFTLDKKRPPFSLGELVAEDYFRTLPPDITGTADSWQEEYCDLLLSPEQSSTGLCDVRSGSALVSSEGTPYNTW